VNGQGACLPPDAAWVCDELHKRLQIGHATVQIEHGDEACKQEPVHVV
jgi:hypothetical protein